MPLPYNLIRSRLTRRFLTTIYECCSFRRKDQLEFSTEWGPEFAKLHLYFVKKVTRIFFLKVEQEESTTNSRRIRIPFYIYIYISLHVYIIKSRFLIYVNSKSYCLGLTFYGSTNVKQNGAWVLLRGITFLLSRQSNSIILHR